MRRTSASQSRIRGTSRCGHCSWFGCLVWETIFFGFFLSFFFFFSVLGFFGFGFGFGFSFGFGFGLSQAMFSCRRQRE
jgi:hypothetical protein